jgi:hypothetical protein
MRFLLLYICRTFWHMTVGKMALLQQQTLLRVNSLPEDGHHHHHHHHLH